MDFHDLTEALRPLGFRPTFVLGPLALATEDFSSRVYFDGHPGQAVVEAGAYEVFRGSFGDIADFLRRGRDAT